MPITDTQSQSVSSTDSSGLSAKNIEVGNTRLGFDVNLAASTTNQLQTMAFTNSTVQSIYILASQNCTIKTNSTGSPATTINLKAGIPLIWGVSPGYFTNPFSAANVTAFYLTSTAACRVQAKILTS